MTADGTRDTEAGETFVKRFYGNWTTADQAALEARLGADAAYADAYRRIEASWTGLDHHAMSPEIMEFREQAIRYARQANARRWFRPYVTRAWKIAAGVAFVAIAGAAAWLYLPQGLSADRYRTDNGERRIIELDDHSRVALDASTRLQVRFTDEARVIELLEGQAQFSVARDAARPFKVHAGDRTIIALGTVFTVEYVDRRVHVATVEGRVAVMPADSAQTGSASESFVPSGQGVALAAGEELRVDGSGQVTFTPHADMEAATAWLAGKVIFRAEPLGEAVRRLNRYSRLQLDIQNPELAALRISGVFEAGDARGFAEAVRSYYHVTVDDSQAGTVRLR